LSDVTLPLSAALFNGSTVSRPSLTLSAAQDKTLSGFKYKELAVCVCVLIVAVLQHARSSDCPCRDKCRQGPLAVHHDGGPPEHFRHHLAGRPSGGHCRSGKTIAGRVRVGDQRHGHERSRALRRETKRRRRPSGLEY
jgi:hypothetical protein